MTFDIKLASVVILTSWILELMDWKRPYNGVLCPFMVHFQRDLNSNWHTLHSQKHYISIDTSLD